MPGVSMGSGLIGLDSITTGDPVAEAQMQALFGHGTHPLADEIRKAAREAGLTEREGEACRLGRPSPSAPLAPRTSSRRQQTIF